PRRPAHPERGPSTKRATISEQTHRPIVHRFAAASIGVRFVVSTPKRQGTNKRTRRTSTRSRSEPALWFARLRERDRILRAPRCRESCEGRQLEVPRPRLSQWGSQGNEPPIGHIERRWRDNDGKHPHRHGRRQENVPIKETLGSVNSRVRREDLVEWA